MATRRNPRAALYGRQSHGKTKSITEQLDACRADAAAEGYRVADEYDDKTSASRYARKDRKGWPQLLADVEAGKVDVVVVWESSRGDRTLTSWSAFLDLVRDRGVLVRVTEHRHTYDPRNARDWRTLAEDGVDNAYESEKTRSRTLRSAAAVAAAGRPNGPAPYGYVRVYDATTKALVRQEPHPEHAAVVAEIVHRVADGEPTLVVAQDLTARGVPSPSGGRWHNRTIMDMVRNPAYIGQRLHQPKDGSESKLYPTTWWAPLVDESRWYAANRVYDSRKGQGWRSGRMSHMLTGLPTCTVCGGVYNGRLNHGKRHYGCTARGCGFVLADELEDLVLAYALGRLARPDVYGKLRRVGEGADREAAAAEAEVARLRKRLEEARDSAASPDGISYEALAVQERKIGKQMIEAQRRVETAGLSPSLRKLVDAGEALPEVWAGMPLAARRDVIRDLVTITVRPAGKGRYVPATERVTVTWRGTA